MRHIILALRFVTVIIARERCRCQGGNPGFSGQNAGKGGVTSPPVRSFRNLHQHFDTSFPGIHQSICSFRTCFRSPLWLSVGGVFATARRRAALDPPVPRRIGAVKAGPRGHRAAAAALTGPGRGGTSSGSAATGPSRGRPAHHAPQARAGARRRGAIGPTAGPGAPRRAGAARHAEPKPAEGGPRPGDRGPGEGGAGPAADKQRQGRPARRGGGGGDPQREARRAGGPRTARRPGPRSGPGRGSITRRYLLWVGRDAAPGGPQQPDRRAAPTARGDGGAAPGGPQPKGSSAAGAVGGAAQRGRRDARNGAATAPRTAALLSLVHRQRDHLVQQGFG